jgi:hypothetical protein
MCLYVLSSVLWCPLRFPHTTMFGSFFPPVVCRREHISYLHFLCLFALSGVRHILCCVFVLFVFVNPMLPFSGLSYSLTFIWVGHWRSHVAPVVINYLAHLNVNVLSWSVVPPDFSPTEHAWDESERSLRNLSNQRNFVCCFHEYLTHFRRIWVVISQSKMIKTD